jgi:hypothetical protein
MNGFVTFIVTITIALVADCALNSTLIWLNLAPKMAVSHQGVRMAGPNPLVANSNKRDVMYADFTLDDTPRTC